MNARHALVLPIGLVFLVPSCIVAPAGRRGSTHVEGRLEARASAEGSGTRPKPVADRVQEQPAATAPSAGLERRNVAVGEAHVCALVDGDVHCWGTNLKGTLGLGTSRAPASGVVRGIGDDSEEVVQVAAGDYHTCALTASAKLWCWGSNFVGQLGQGKVTERPINTPQQVRESGIRAVYAGAKGTCVSKEDGSVDCWGQNTAGAIRSGKRPVTTPTLVPALQGAEELAVGSYGICALRAGRVRCTGWLADRNEELAALPPVTSLTAGWGHACAAAADKVYCWGRNFDGAVGLGDLCAGERSKEAKSRCRLRQADVFHPPQPVPGVTEKVVQVSDTCALLASGKVSCWAGKGQTFLADRPPPHYQTAHTIEGFEAVEELYVGDTFICVLRDGQLTCRGQPWANAVSAAVPPSNP